MDTDDPAIADEGRRWGAEVPFLRPEPLAGDKVPTIDTVLGALDGLARLGLHPDAVVLLQPTSPLRSADEIAACIARFDPRTAPSVVSIVEAEHPAGLAMVRSEEGILSWQTPPPGGVVRRQAFRQSWFVSGAVYVNSVEFLRSRRAFLADGVTAGVPRPKDAGLDIDTGQDLRMARALARSAAITPADRVDLMEDTDAPRFALDALPDALDALDTAGGTGPGRLLLTRDPSSPAEAPDIAGALGLWRWATGARIGWQHDAARPWETVAAVAGGASFVVAGTATDPDRSQLGRWIDHARLLLRTP